MSIGRFAAPPYQPIGPVTNCKDRKPCPRDGPGTPRRPHAEQGGVADAVVVKAVSANKLPVNKARIEAFMVSCRLGIETVHN
jgi:hypothetical protein